jgi:hypothetical protein
VQTPFAEEFQGLIKQGARVVDYHTMMKLVQQHAAKKTPKKTPALEELRKNIKGIAEKAFGGKEHKLPEKVEISLGEMMKKHRTVEDMVREVMRRKKS